MKIVYEICNLVITLSYPSTLKSLRDFCTGSQIDESSRNTLSGLFKLFACTALELNKTILSNVLISISNDLTLIQNKLGSDKHPISVLANCACDFTDKE